MHRGRNDGIATSGGARSEGANGQRRKRRGIRRFTSLLATSLLMGTAAAPLVSHSAQALGVGQTVDLRVLLIGNPAVSGVADPTTAAWAAGLTSQGVAYKEVDGVGSLGSETITLPALTSSATHGLFNGVVVAGKPGDFVAHALDSLSAYESTFGVRQLDGNFVPPAGGVLGLNPVTDSSSGSLIGGTTPTLNTAGLAAFPALAGQIPFDTGTFGAPGAVQASLPTGATETPLLSDSAGNVLIGVYQHPPTGDTQANVQELTLGFNYNLNMTQWLLLGPGLIDWVTGGAHVGLYRNYSTLHVDDVFTPDDTWDTTTHANDYDPAAALRMRPVDVDNEAVWSKANNYRLDNLFNGGNSTTNNVETPTADALLAEFQKTDPATGKPYTQDFGWLNHTWDHAYLDVGCATTNYVEAEVQQNSIWAAAAPGATKGTGGLGLTSSTDPTITPFGTENPSTLVPGGHSGFANLLLGANDAVDPPSLDDEVLNPTGGTLAAGSYQWALTDQFNGADPITSDESSASVTTPIAITAGESVTLSWEGVCHAANYRVYREVAGSNNWSLIGQVTPGASATPPATVTADPTGGSTTVTTGGGMQEQTFLDTGAAGTAQAGWVPPTLENAHELPWEQNPNFVTALNALAMTSVGTDASKPYPNPASTAFGIGVNYAGATYPANAAFPDGNFEGVPRHPINIFYNNSTEKQAVDEYNTIYEDTAHGGKCVNSSTTTCLTTAATFSTIVSSVVTGMFANMVNNDPRPTYVHQTNIMGTAPATIPATPPATSTAVGDGLLYSVLNPLLAKYHLYFTALAPYQQPAMAQIGTILNEQSAWAANQVPGTASTANTVAASQTGGDITITNNGATAVTVPVTSPLGYSIVDPILGSQPFGTQYGGTRSAWETIAPGAHITISAAPPAITSLATANAEVGSAFTFAVTTSGTAPVTLTETGAMPAGLTYTPGAVAGTATISGTPQAGSGGTYPITFNATNITGPPGATQQFSLFVAEPKLSVAASTNPPSFAVAGTPMTASYLVTNTGNVALVGVGVTDPLFPPPAISCPATTLLVGASETCTASYVVTQTDVDAGGINLAATASGTAPSTTVVHATSNLTTPAIQGPAIAVAPSTAPGSFFGAGTPVTFNYLLTNSGNVTLHGVGVSDPLSGLSAISCPSTTLAPAATETCTASYKTTSANVKAKGIKHSATATGTPPSGPAVHGTSTTTVPFWAVPAITSAKLTTVPRQTHLDFGFKTAGLPAPALTLTGKLPKGVTFDAATGKLSGVVNAAGTYPLTLTASSAAGTTHQSFTLHVTAPELTSSVLAQPGNKKATVKWKAPVLHGGLPVTGYVVTPYLGHTALPSHTFHSTAKHQVIGGLSNGRSYVFKVAVMNRLGTGPNSLSASQINALGTGPTSTASPAVKIGAPTAPSFVKASPSKNIAGALVVQFSGASGNGSPITRYTATCVSHNGGGTRSAVATDTSARDIVVTGATVGKTYVCSITATNKRGNGPAAASNRTTA